MLGFIRNLYLTNRFFLVFGSIAALFALSFALPWLFPVAQTAIAVAAVLTVVDSILLFLSNGILHCTRQLPKVFSLSDENPVRIELRSTFPIALHLTLIDELPIQFQRRDFALKLSLPSRGERSITYLLRPLTRGEYTFHHINIYAASVLGLVQKRHRIASKTTVPVYPSIIQMKQFELKAMARLSHYQGIKRIRRVGHSYEFEQIKNYVRGDDYRSINWKATGRRNELMVNQYEDERAQQIYAVIDKSRSMKMPFNGLSLFDYAINTSLVILNVALQKHDKAGLIGFSDKMGTMIRAERHPNQLRKLLNALYKEKERDKEANYELLYRSCRNMIKGRSLLFLYTNFESMYALERVLPVLRRLNSFHLLVVIFFENTEVRDYIDQTVENVEAIYFNTIAQKFVAEKRQIVQKLRQYGIQAILTRPEDLSINTVNKYLELKARGMI